MLSSMVSKMMGVQSEPQGASANAQIKIKQLPRPAAPKFKAASDKELITSSTAPAVSEADQLVDEEMD